MSLTLPVREVVQIDDGPKTGVITKVEERTTEAGYKYVDIYVKINDMNNVTIKESAPASVSTNTKLGKILLSLGVDITQKEVDIEQLVEKQIAFMTLNETTQKGTFANIVDGSIKPIVV